MVFDVVGLNGDQHFVQSGEESKYESYQILWKFSLITIVIRCKNTSHLPTISVEYKI